jgi:catechol 2,3-dioxygenase-like lactoylglutathione lyase family enzyme
MRILEIQLLTPSLEESVEFYCGLLEFEMLQNSDQLLSIQCGDTVITFRPSNGAAALYHFAFEIPHNKFDEAYDWFNERVDLLPITSDSFIADFVNWKAKSFYFYDSHGNILECIARFEADTHSKEKFNSRSINYISEIGIVSDKVAETIHQVQLDFNIPVFSRQPAYADFAALGDDQGLFIVASNNRSWYPTETRSRHSLIRIAFEQHGNRYEWTVA